MVESIIMANGIFGDYIFIGYAKKYLNNEINIQYNKGHQNFSIRVDSYDPKDLVYYDKIPNYDSYYMMDLECITPYAPNMPVAHFIIKNADYDKAMKLKNILLKHGALGESESKGSGGIKKFNEYCEEILMDNSYEDELEEVMKYIKDGNASALLYLTDRSRGY